MAFRTAWSQHGFSTPQHRARRPGRDNQQVLSISIYRQLSSLMSQIHVLLARVEADAPSDEVALRVTAIRQVLDDLQENVSAGPTGAFNSLARHLHWLH